MKAPAFWREDSFPSRLLSPLGWIYGTVASARAARSGGIRVDVPVVCVGNFVTGGAGKTPVALALADWFAVRGRTPHFLTRGYGGRLAGPVRVEAGRHHAGDVGDEALLLAGKAPTWVSRDRPAGASAAVEAGADLIIMDDGFQNPTLFKDICVVVVDGAYGIGNGRPLPAGPLREPIESGLARADIIVLLGPHDGTFAASLPPETELIEGALTPVFGTPSFRGRRVIAFAGIGRPEKFFDTVAGLGCEVLATKAFPDHHVYTDSELADLRDRAAKADAALMTTEKDLVRIGRDRAEGLTVLPIAVVWSDEQALEAPFAGVLRHG